MIVMEFFEGAVEIGDAEVDETVIDEGLAADPAHLGRRASRTATSSPRT